MDLPTYRDGRRKAAAAAEAIQVALAALGLPESVRRSVRPLVTRSGKPYVHLGMMSADAAEKMAAAIRSSGSA